MKTAILKLVGVLTVIILYILFVPAGLVALTVVLTPTLLSLWWRTFNVWILIINVCLGWTGVAYGYALLWAWQGVRPTWKDCTFALRSLCRFANLKATVEDIPPRRMSTAHA